MRRVTDRPQHRRPPTAWLSLQPPLWVPVAWWAALVVSIIFSIAGDPGPTCTAANPCEPDPVFPMVVSLVCVAALAFWWAPQAALLAGFGYGALGAAFDPSVPGRYAAAVVGALALAGWATLRALRRRQAELARDAASTDPLPTWALAPDRRRVPRRGWIAFAAPAAGIAGLIHVDSCQDARLG
jgi:hypothetical protein